MYQRPWIVQVGGPSGGIGVLESGLEKVAAWVIDAACVLGGGVATKSRQ